MKAVSQNWLSLKGKLGTGPGGTGKRKPGKRKAESKLENPSKRRPPVSPAAAAPSLSGAKRPSLPPVPLEPLCAPDAEWTDMLALDCEMVGVGSSGSRSALAQIVIVNEREQLVYSSYVRPPEQVTDYRTSVSGVRPSHMARAQAFRPAQLDIAARLARHTLVGHALANDFKALMISHPRRLTRDTALFPAFQDQKSAVPRARKLKTLAEEQLGMVIQTGEHSPVEDAIAALRLYKSRASEWERMIRQGKDSAVKPVQMKKGRRPAHRNAKKAKRT